MSRFHRLALTVLAGSVAFALLAPSASGTAPITRGFTKDANKTCANYQARLDKLLKRSKDAETDRQYAAVLEDTGKLLGKLGEDLVKVTAPEEKATRYAALIQAFRDVAKHYEKAADAFRDGDADEARRETKKGVDASERGVRLSKRLNLPACGDG